VSKDELLETQFDKIVRDKIASIPTWSEKITVLSTFFKFLLNFLFNNLKNYKIWYQENCQKYSLRGQ